MTGDAIRRQQDDNLYTCSYNGWEVVATYTDQSRSAFSGAERPEFDRMVRDFRAGKFDVIVAWKLDRLVRRVGTLTDMVREVQGERPEDGLRICTGDCGLLDLTRPDGRYLATLFANNAELESARKGERERRANLQHALEGNPRRASQRCYGYTHDRKIVTDEAALVRACYKAYTNGHAMNAILRALNGDESSVAYPALKTALAGLEAPQKWTRTRLKYMLINPKYAGFVAYVSEPATPGAKRKQRARIVADHVLRDENGAPVRGNWEPIIDEATWFKAAELAKARSHGEQPNWRKHIGSGVTVAAFAGNRSTFATGRIDAVSAGMSAVCASQSTNWSWRPCVNVSDKATWRPCCRVTRADDSTLSSMSSPRSRVDLCAIRRIIAPATSTVLCSKCGLTRRSRAATCCSLSVRRSRATQRAVF